MKEWISWAVLPALLLFVSCRPKETSITRADVAGVWQAADGTTLLLDFSELYVLTQMDKYGTIGGTWDVNTDSTGEKRVVCRAFRAHVSQAYVRRFHVIMKNNTPYRLRYAGKEFEKCFAMDIHRISEARLYQFYSFDAGFAMMRYDTAHDVDEEPEMCVVLTILNRNGAVLENVKLNAIDEPPRLDSIRGTNVYISYPDTNEDFVWGLWDYSRDLKLHYVLSMRIRGVTYIREIDKNGNLQTKRIVNEIEMPL